MGKKIKMITSTPGTVNGGLNVVMYKKDLVYKVEDMSPDVVETFLKIKAAEVYQTPDEVLRHQKGLTGAPENKREKVPENKEVDPDNGDDSFTLEELEGSKAKDIRALGKENNIDLSDLPKNTSAEVLINAYLDRQGQ